MKNKKRVQLTIDGMDVNVPEDYTILQLSLIHILTLVMMVYFLFFAPVFALITLVGLCAGMAVLHMIQKAAAKHTPKVLAAQENMTIQALEYIRGISVLRAFSQDGGSENAVSEAFEQKRQADLDQEYASLPLSLIHIY